MYNIMYDVGDGKSRLYLKDNCDIETALRFLYIFRRLYIGQSYPNNKGKYPFANPRVVKIDAN